MSSVFPTRPASTLAELPTPCLVLERGKLAQNLARMAATLAIRRVGFRPHLKTAKSAAIAHLAAPSPHGALTVSTLREADYFAHHGWRDLFYAVGLGPGKLEAVAALRRRGVQLLTMVDHVEAAHAVRRFAQRERLALRTVVEIDCGEHRGGVPAESDELIEVARALGGAFAGVATHGGQSYGARSREEFDAIAQIEADTLRRAATRLHAGGLASEVVSLGSSPTALAAVDLAGITEVRAGVYMFWDCFQAGIGACAIEDIALSVLAEIIGRPGVRPNEFLIDAGAFALSKDTSTAALAPEKNVGFGLVCDVDGHVIPGLRVEKVWQEHGLIRAPAPIPAGLFRIGDRVRILPNHACPTAAAHDRYHVVNGAREVVGEWTRVNGW